MTLTDKKIEKLTKPGLYRADRSLYLRIRPTGCKSWIQRITIDGQRTDLGLGPWPEITVDDARISALENRRDNLKGEMLKPTFKAAASDWLERNAGKWKRETTAGYIENSFERYAYPVIGNMKIDRIRVKNIEDVLLPIFKDSKPTAAKELRRRMSAVFELAEARQYITHNPCGKALDAVLPATNGHKQQRAMTYKAVPDAYAHIRDSDNVVKASQYCLEFVVLTATRSAEARGARWDEIEGANWTIPADRMKTKRAHVVPLSDASLAVLEKAKGISDGSGLVFPAPRCKGRVLNPISMSRVLKAVGYHDKTTVHGFRSSFRTWAAECTNFDLAVMEKSLAHNVGSQVERSYDRSKLANRRRELMSQWAAFATRQKGDVVTLTA